MPEATEVKQDDLLAYMKSQGDAIDSQQKVNAALVARLADTGKVDVKIDGRPANAGIVVPGDEALLSDKSLIPSYRVKGVDVMQGGVGFAVAVLATELVDGFLVPATGATPEEIKTNGYVRGGIKMAFGVASLKWGGRVFGDTGKKVIAVLTIYDGLRDIVPFDTWIKTNIADKITKASPTQGLTQGKPSRQPSPSPTGSFLEI